MCVCAHQFSVIYVFTCLYKRVLDSLLVMLLIVLREFGESSTESVLNHLGSKHH